MRRSRALVAAVSLALLALLAPVAVAQAATTVSSNVDRIDVNSLPRGPKPQVSYLTGRLLHTASGRVIEMSFPKDHKAWLELLGRCPRGWLVADRARQEIYAIWPDGSKHARIDIADAEPGYPGFSDLTLSSNHRLLLATFVQRDDTTLLTVYNLRGDIVDSYFSGFGPNDELDRPVPIRFVGRDVYLVKSWVAGQPLMRWGLGSEPADTGWASVLQVDLVHDQMLWKPPGSSLYGLSKMSAPDVPLWTAPVLVDRPVSFSSDGTKFLGPGASSNQAFVQGASDGRVVAGYRFRANVANAEVVALRWEGSRHLLVEIAKRMPGETSVSPDDSHAVLRCGLHGRCLRTTVWQKRWLLTWSLPF